MKDTSMAKVGGVCAILAGIAYLALGIIFFLLPETQRPGGGYSEAVFFQTGSMGYGLLVAEMWAISLSAIFAIAVVMAVSDLVRPANEGLVRYSSTLAVIGFAVIAVTYLLDQWHTPQLLDGYAKLDKSGQAVLDVIGTRHLDPEGIWGFGMVGLWFMITSVLAIRGGQYPKIFAYLGLVCAIAYWCVVGGRMLVFAPLIAIAAGLGGVLGPIWYIGMGLFLLNGGERAGVRTSTSVRSATGD